MGGGGNAKLSGKTSDWTDAEQVIGSLSLFIWALPVKVTYLQVPVKRKQLPLEQSLATMICNLIFGLV